MRRKADPSNQAAVVPVADDADDMLDDDDLTASRELVPEMSESEKREFALWLLGVSDTPPPAISRMMNKVFGKLVWASAAHAANGINRATRLQGFLQKAEAHIFDADQLHTLDEEDILKRYTLAYDVQRHDLEYARKFLANHKDNLEDADVEYDELAEILRGMPRDKVREIKGRLQRGEL